MPTVTSPVWGEGCLQEALPLKAVVRVESIKKGTKTHRRWGPLNILYYLFPYTILQFLICISVFLIKLGAPQGQGLSELSFSPQRIIQHLAGIAQCIVRWMNKWKKQALHLLHRESVTSTPTFLKWCFTLFAVRIPKQSSCPLVQWSPKCGICIKHLSRMIQRWDAWGGRKKTQELPFVFIFLYQD